MFEQTGVYTTSNYRAGVVGVITADGNGNYTSGEYDSNVLGYWHNYSGLTGTYTNTDPTTGRYTQATTLKGITDHRVIYLVSGTKFLELTTDALSSSTVVLVGEAQLQSSSSPLTGKLVYYGSEPGSVQFGLATVTGSSTFTANGYQDNAGTWTNPSPTVLSCGYGIDSYGRLETGIGSGCLGYALVSYLSGPNTGVVMGLDGGVWMGQLEPQSATSISAGNYFVGTQETVNPNVETYAGTGTLTSAGITGTCDTTSTASSQQANQPIAETLTVNSDGTFSTSDHLGVISGIVISNSEIVLVDNQTSSYPTILVISKVPTE